MIPPVRGAARPQLKIDNTETAQKVASSTEYTTSNSDARRLNRASIAATVYKRLPGGIF